MTLLEMELGVRVYVRRLPSEISGLMAYDDVLGACIMLNASHRRDRRAQTGAHEMAHLGCRRTAEVLKEQTSENTREERYASAFGRGFLTPARTVMQKFKEVTAGSERLSRRHVIILANFFGVSREATVRRLEELKLVKLGAWDWFDKNGNITDEQERQVLGELGLARISHTIFARSIGSADDFLTWQMLARHRGVGRRAARLELFRAVAAAKAWSRWALR